VCPLCRSPAGCPVGVGCGVPTPSPSTTSFDVVVFLLRLRLLFRVSPVHRGGHRFPDRQAGHEPVVRSFRGFSPLQRFPSRAEPPSPGELPAHRLRCALRVSHPLDALLPARPAGLIPSRSRSWGSLLEALIRARRRTPSPAPGPSWGSYQLRRTGPPLQGFSTSREARPRHPGFSQVAVSRASTSLLSSEASCPRRPAGRYTRSSPLVLSRLGLHADLAAGTPGCLPPGTQPFSLEIGATSMELSYLVGRLASSEAP
jgi:hypothetical protein